MKKKLFALSGVFLIVLVVTGLWATRATDNNGVISEEGQNPQGTETMVNAMSTQEMTVRAELIVIGRCVGTRSEWIDGSLFTLATIAATETLKNDVGASETFDVVLPGGVDANRRIPVAMTYAGAPQIARDEEVFLFLTTQDGVANGYAVMGFAQGKFSIANDTAGEKFITPDATIATIDSSNGIRRGTSQAIRLAEFKARVMSFLN
jgi:hypothetical protein